MEPWPKVRLFVEAPLVDDAPVVVADRQAHYLTNVMRAGVGAGVRLFNGVDGEWLAEIVALSKRSLTLLPRRCLRVQTASPDLWLLFAPVKRARIDLIVEKATELGVSSLLPVHTTNTMIDRVNGQRLSAIATEAAEQCGRLEVPVVEPPRDLADVLATWPGHRRLLHLDESGGGRPIGEVLAATGAHPIAFLTGPEGGFTKSELDGLRRLSFAAGVGLGPRILRADTAVVAALACYQALCGDWPTQSTSTSSLG